MAKPEPQAIQRLLSPGRWALGQAYQFLMPTRKGQDRKLNAPQV